VKKTRKTPTAASASETEPRLPAFFTRLSLRGESDGRRRSFYRALFRSALVVGLCAALVLTAVLTVGLAMVDTTRDQIVGIGEITSELEAGAYDCILVLGAGVRPDGSPSSMLLDRVKVACELYESAGDADLPLLMSGDHTGSYNEVGAMEKLAVEAGVPSEQIFLDHEGYSTYESLYRAKHVFGAEKMVIVTQEYHLYRALHIARELGIEAVGIPADLRPYRKQKLYELRECLARFKDMFTAAKGEYSGQPDPPVSLKGNGNLTD
jgi:vancomycin permeability regulator SanA